MTIAELALLITTLSGAVAALIGASVALMKTRTDSELGKHERDELRQESLEQRKQIEKLEAFRVTDRRDIILIGESLAQARSDNAILAEAFNQIWSEFYRATGHRPEANLEALKRLQTLQYITGKLGPLNVEQ